MIELRIPDLGEGVEQGTVIAVLVAAGSTVVRDQPLFEVETDKVTLEIPAPAAGIIESLMIIAGSVVRPAEVIGQWSPLATAAAPRVTVSAVPVIAPAPSAPGEVVEAVAERVVAERALSVTVSPLVAAGPAARREARELGLALDDVAVTAHGARVTREDVRRHARGRFLQGSERPSAPTDTADALPDLAAFGPVHAVPLTRIERASARNLVHAATVIPHAWVTRITPIDALETARRAYRHAQSADAAPLTVTAVLCKALALALEQFPRFNAAYDAAAHSVIYRDYIHLGVAVDTPQGLLVPVLRDVRARSLLNIAEALASLSAQARRGEPTALTRHAASMTVTNLGGLGVNSLQPIVNWPEVAILGVGAVDERWSLHDGTPCSALQLSLTLGFDHRVVNGADAARLLAYLADLLATPMQMMVQI